MHGHESGECRRMCGICPPTCAYRLLVEGRDLPDWHPLVSGDPGSVHAAGISVRGRVISESDIGGCDLEERIVEWPLFDAVAKDPIE